MRAGDCIKNLRMNTEETCLLELLTKRKSAIQRSVFPKRHSDTDSLVLAFYLLVFPYAIVPNCDTMNCRIE